MSNACAGYLMSFFCSVWPILCFKARAVKVCEQINDDDICQLVHVDNRFSYRIVNYYF